MRLSMLRQLEEKEIMVRRNALPPRASCLGLLVTDDAALEHGRPHAAAATIAVCFVLVANFVS